MKKKNASSAPRISRRILKIFTLFSLFVAFALFPTLTSMQTMDGNVSDTIFQNSRSAEFAFVDSEAFWRGEGNAQDSISSNHGVLQGNTNFAAGRVGQAFNFDGLNDSVNVPNSPLVSRGANAPVSFNLWAYRADNRDGVHILGKRVACGDDNSNYQMGIHLGSGYGFYFGSANGYAGVPTNVIPVNQWVMLTGTFDGSTLRIYKNGVFLDATDATLGPENNAPFEIGSSGTCDQLNQGWYGRLDEVRAFDRALSQTEIQTIYNNEAVNFTISGQITRNGLGLSGVSVALSGGASGSTTTDGNGNYSFTVADGGSYTVTPTLANNTFTPPSQTFNFISQNQTANFTAQTVTYTISGNVRSDGANLQGATVALTGGQTASVLTGADGNYSFSVPAGTNYSVSVYKNGITFNPASQSFTNLNANQTANFQNGTPLCAPPSAGLVGWYRAEDNINDSSGLGLNGSLQNGASYSNGKVGRNFLLDGVNDYVDLPDVPANSPTTAVSLQAWIKPRSIGTGQAIISNLNASNDNGTYHFVLQSDGSLQLSVYQSTTIYRAAVTAPNVISPNVFQHVAATFDTSNQAMRIYVNGVSLPVTILYSNVTSLFDVATHPRIGAYTITGSFGAPFNGEIDEVQIHNRALSASEIAAIYNAGSAGVCSVSCVNVPSSSFAAWYKAEDTPIDSSGNGNTGTLSGNATYVAGKVARAFQFNGNTAAFTVPDSTSLRPDANSFSVDFWIKAYSFPAGANVAIASKRNESTNAYGWAVLRDGTSGKWRVETRDSFGNFTNAYSTTTAATGTYVHIAFVVDGNGSYLRLYVNGVQEAAQPMASFGSFSSTDPLRLGGNSVVQQYLNGEIDEFRIYRNRYTPSEIQAIVNAGNGVGCQDTAVFTPTNANGKIAFASSRTGNSDIFVMNADGSNQTNITNNPSVTNYEPAWSPNGNKFVFSIFSGNNSDIYTMNADGTNKTRLTTDTSSDNHPSWSPDGTKVVFWSFRTGNGDIFIMNADGTNQTRLTTSSANDYIPSFSPDGSKIIFESTRDGDFEIYTMNSDGSNQTRITNTPGDDRLAKFSPDGTKIVFRSLRTGNAEIFLMNTDGSNQVNLSNNSAFDSSPIWSPDGTKIAFNTNRDGNDEIYVMNTDGTNQTRLTNNTAQDYYPAWQRISSNVTIAPASNVNLTFANVSQAGNTVATPLTAAQIPALPNGVNLFSSAPIYDVRTSAAYSGNVIVRFNVPNVSAQTCSELQMIHFENGAWTSNGNGTPVYNPATQVCALSQTVTSLSPFGVIQFAPTAADVSVSGRVLTANGRGITNTTVTITDADGVTRSTLTGSFGFYNFDNVRAGETYIVQVKSKSFSFDQPAQIISVQENVGEIDFIANESR